MKTKQIALCGLFAVMLALAYSCGDMGDGGDTEEEEDGDQSTVPGNTLAEKLAWLAWHMYEENAQSGETYTITVSANETIAQHTLTYANRSNITIILKGSGGEKVVSLSGNGSLFTIENGVTLVLDSNITLKGHSSNNDSVIIVNSGGALEMKAGAKITGNTAGGGGGVDVCGGTFTMNGGEISGNTASAGGGVLVWQNGSFIMNGGIISSNTADGGGGVDVDEGTFTMNSGEISGNTATNVYDAGGGVIVRQNGSFIMNGGTISGNTASIDDDYWFCQGGGVCVGEGTFVMNNGKIFGNTSNVGGGMFNNGTFTMNGGEISGNNVNSDGGGVASGGTFTMNGGKISGNNSDVAGGGVEIYGTFTMNGGEISGNTARWGGGVFENYGTFTMNGGEISGNTAEGGGGVSVYGYDDRHATFRMVTGTVYGSDTSAGVKKNTATNGEEAALAIHIYGTAQCGTFNGAAWNSVGTLSTTNNTIRVVNGVLQ
jgi:hypothetical protein